MKGAHMFVHARSIMDKNAWTKFNKCEVLKWSSSRLITISSVIGWKVNIISWDIKIMPQNKNLNIQYTCKIKPVTGEAFFCWAVSSEEIWARIQLYPGFFKEVCNKSQYNYYSFIVVWNTILALETTEPVDH